MLQRFSSTLASMLRRDRKLDCKDCFNIREAKHCGTFTRCFSHINRLCFWENVNVFAFTSKLVRHEILCLATTKLCTRQSCTKLSRDQTWILCCPSEIKSVFH